jgi:hypothetical protein
MTVGKVAVTLGGPLLPTQLEALFQLLLEDPVQIAKAVGGATNCACAGAAKPSAALASTAIGGKPRRLDSFRWKAKPCAHFRLADRQSARALRRQGTLSILKKLRRELCADTAVALMRVHRSRARDCQFNIFTASNSLVGVPNAIR